MKSRRPIIVGNWKMYKTLKDGEELVNALKRQLFNIGYADIAICPPYTLLVYIADMLESSNIGLGAQDVFWEEQGAFTGEISPAMLKDAGCQYVIIGHSERRQFFGETNDSVNKKIVASLKCGLTPIVCIGENLNQREKGLTFDVLKDHLEGALKGLDLLSIEQLIIAYEPVWAIGTGKVATPDQAQEAHKYIRNWFSDTFSDEIAQKVRILYGGSVKPDNIAGLILKEDIDGALVGGASLTADGFTAIVLNSKTG